MDKMPELIEGFSQIEYLLIFNAIVFGAIASEYFSGWGAMLRNRENVTFSLIQFIWSIFAFMLLVQNWFGIWPRSKYINDGVAYFYFSLIPMLLFYLISVVLFPQMKVNSPVNFQLHYEKNVRILFILFAGYLLFTIVGSFIYLDKDKGNILYQNLIRVAGIILCLISAYYEEKKWIHYICLGMHMVGLVIFIFQIPK
jgi:hypothetical protein